MSIQTILSSFFPGAFGPTPVVAVNKEHQFYMDLQEIAEKDKAAKTKIAEEAELKAQWTLAIGELQMDHVEAVEALEERTTKALDAAAKGKVDGMFIAACAAKGVSARAWLVKWSTLTSADQADLCKAISMCSDKTQTIALLTAVLV